MTELHVAKGLSLPLDAVTQTFGILARKGAGKTYTAAVFAEELIGAGLAVVILDPLGAFWGLRSSADGEKAGLPVTILGGEHGDVPLEPGAGKVIADLVVEQPGAYILDLSAFESNAAQDRFVTDFAERLYRLKATHREPLHLIVDEADSFAPQRPMPGQQRMLGAFEAIVRRGRIRGLGVTLITQRPAVLNKNVLTQIECLVVLQITGPQDRKAIDEWVAGNGTKEERDQLVASLAGLQQGEAWFWSPAWLRVFTQAKVRRRRTFDSSRTPEPGEVLQPKRMAPVDLEKLRTRMQAAIAKAAAEDPRTLQARIRELERQVAAQPAATPEPEKVVERIEVPVLNGQVERLEAVVGELRTIGEGMVLAGTGLAGVADSITTAIAQVGAGRPTQLTTAAIRAAQSRPVAPHPVAAVPEAPRREAAPSNGGARPQKAGARRMLEALAQLHPTPLTRPQLGTLAEVSLGGTFTSYLSSLNAGGLIESHPDGRIALSDYGAATMRDRLGSGAPSTDELVAMYGRKLKLGARRMLDILVDRYPEPIASRAELAQLAEVTLGGTFTSYLSSLRRNGLVDEAGAELRAGATLFMRGGR